MAGELARRVAVAGVGIPLTVVLLYLGGWVLGLAFALLAALGSIEFCGLAEQRGVRPYRPLAAALGAALVAFAVSHSDLGHVGLKLWLAVVVTALIASIASLWLRRVDESPLAAVSVTVVGPLLVGGGLAFGMLLRNLDPVPGASWVGAALVAYPLAVTWVGDSAAYFVGLRWGRRKLSPILSPKKTIEGAVAGFAGSVAAGAVFGWLVFEQWLGIPIGALPAALGAALIAAAGQLGDLVESLFKREAGVKDSGSLFPGHGGVLDRFDALILALPAAYAYLTFILPLGLPLPWRLA